MVVKITSVKLVHFLYLSYQIRRRDKDRFGILDPVKVMFNFYILLEFRKKEINDKFYKFNTI